MTSPRFIVIDGKRHLWRDIMRLRREQLRAHANVKQPALFELIDDRRPPAERTAARRYLEPTLFESNRRTSCDNGWPRAPLHGMMPHRPNSERKHPKRTGPGKIGAYPGGRRASGRLLYLASASLRGPSLSDHAG